MNTQRFRRKWRTFSHAALSFKSHTDWDFKILTESSFYRYHYFKSCLDKQWMSSHLDILLIFCFLEKNQILTAPFFTIFSNSSTLSVLFPFIQISWILVWFAQDPFYLYAARLIGGSFGKTKRICCAIEEISMILLFLLLI